MLCIRGLDIGAPRQFGHFYFVEQSSVKLNRVTSISVDDNRICNKKKYKGFSQSFCVDMCGGNVC